MERNIINQLQRWKNSPTRKPAVLTGVRQCGKTYVLKQFGEREFENTLYINFERDEDLSEIFDHDYRTDRILRELAIASETTEVVPGKTLVILDEIQVCPRAITSLKYFCEDMPQLHIVAAGSLLGVAIRQKQISFPVGKVDRFYMYPMSFEEFVRADSGGKYLDGIRNLDLTEPLPKIYVTALEKYYNYYLIVGGMPAAVNLWCETHNINLVEEVQDTILSDYADDFSKHAPSSELPRMRMIWDSIPTQLVKENNKFIFSHVKKGAKSRDLEESLEWLVSAGLIHKLTYVSTPGIPLAGAVDATMFKVYMSDVGLLRRREKINYRTILSGDYLSSQYKGAMTENYVMTQLKSLGFTPYYWKSENTAELDFMIDAEGLLTPIEVKSADNTKAKSLQIFCKRYKPQIAFKISLKNVGDNDFDGTRLWSLPLYAIYRLPEYLNDTLRII